jgi:hypothetical protein
MPGRLPPQCLVLMNDACLVERGLHIEDGLLGRFYHRVEPSQDGHGQDNIAVFAANVQVAQHVVVDAPDEVCDPVKLSLLHVFPLSSRGLTLNTSILAFVKYYTH